MATRRPPLNRGHSAPTYPTHLTSYGPADPAVSSLASLSLSDSRNNSVGDLMRRGASASATEETRPVTPPYELTPEGYSPYASSSATSTGLHSQPHPSPYPSSMPRSKSHHSQPSSSFPPYPNPPAITSPPANISSVLLRSRSVPPQSTVNLKIDSTPHAYTLLAPLGSGFSSDSITIAARKGNVIVVLADRWDQEQDSHYEWQVQFDKDADMSSIHARFENGLLKVTVRRITNYIGRS